MGDGIVVKEGREVASLHGLIRVQRVEPPPTVVFVVRPEMVKTGEDGVPEMHGHIEPFVRLASLSPEVRALVRKEMSASELTTEELIEQLHPDTKKEFEEQLTARKKIEEEADAAMEAGESDVGVDAKEMFAGDPVKMARAIIEKELGEPIPDFIKTTPEAMADILALHGHDEVISVAQTIKKEIEYYRMVNEQGVDPEEATLRVFGPPPGP